MTVCWLLVFYIRVGVETTTTILVCNTINWLRDKFTCIIKKKKEKLLQKIALTPAIKSVCLLRLVIQYCTLSQQPIHVPVPFPSESE